MKDEREKNKKRGEGEKEWRETEGKREGETEHVCMLVCVRVTIKLLKTFNILRRKRKIK